MPDDVENNKNRILKVFSDYCPVQETIKLPIKDINKSIFKALIKSNELTKGARENYFITEMKLSSVKNKKNEKEYSLDVSILPSKQRAFKRDKDLFSFQNIISQYTEQLDKNTEKETLKLKSKHLTRLIRNLGYLHNFKKDHSKFSLKISSIDPEELEFDTENIEKIFTGIFEKTCKAWFPYEFESSDSAPPMLMIYNAFAHLKMTGKKSITVPYGKKS